MEHPRHIGGSRSQKGPSARSRRVPLVQQQERSSRALSKFTSLRDRGRDALHSATKRIKSGYTPSPAFMKQRIQIGPQANALSSRSTESSILSWRNSDLDSHPSRDSTCPTPQEDFAKRFFKAFSTNLPSVNPTEMKRTLPREHEDAPMHTRRKVSVSDPPTPIPFRPFVENARPPNSEFIKHDFPDKAVSSSEWEAPELSNLGSQFDVGLDVSSRGKGHLEVTRPQLREALNDSLTSGKGQTPEGLGSDPRDLARPPRRQETTYSDGQASSVDGAPRRFSADSLSTGIFSRPQSIASTAPSIFEAPPRATAVTGRLPALTKRATSSSASVNTTLDLVIHRQAALGNVDYKDLGDNFALASEPLPLNTGHHGPLSSTAQLPVNMTEKQNAESVRAGEDLSRDMTQLHLDANGAKPRTDLEESLDEDIDLCPDLCMLSRGPADRGPLNGSVFLRLQPAMQPPMLAIQASGADAMPSNSHLSLPARSRNTKHDDEHAEPGTAHGERRLSLSTISEGYSDHDCFILGQMPAISRSTNAKLTRGDSGTSLAQSTNSRSVRGGLASNAPSPHALPITPATSVADHIEAEENAFDGFDQIESDSEDDDDDSVSTEETDDSLVEAFIATSLDPRLLLLTMILKDRIRQLVLPKVTEWIKKAANSSSRDSQGTSSSSQAPNNTANEGSNVTGGPALHNSSLKRSLDSGGGDGSEQDDQDGNGKRQKGDGGYQLVPQGRRLRLACPYVKRFPERQHPTTCLTGYLTVSRIKEHLYRNHGQPIHCDRCFCIFKDAEELKRHTRRSPSCEVRDEAENPGFEGIDRITMEKLRSKKGLKAIQGEPKRWGNVWKILFPGVACPSPDQVMTDLDDEEVDLDCLENRLSREDCAQYRDFLYRMLPNRLITEIHSGIGKSPLLAPVRANHTQDHYKEFSDIVYDAVWKALQAVLPIMLPNEEQHPQPPAWTVPSSASVQQPTDDASGPSSFGQTDTSASYSQDLFGDPPDWSQPWNEMGNLAAFETAQDAADFATDSPQNASFPPTGQNFNGSTF